MFFHRVCRFTGRHFFFSSRRRHTRSLCDWSSDVCSSDLASSTQSKMSRMLVKCVISITSRIRFGTHRSEERRVGKEVRSRCAAEHRRKKQEHKQQRQEQQRRQ